MRNVIFDLDGTLADISHRLHYIKRLPISKQDWSDFFEACDKDVPIKTVTKVMHAHVAAGHNIWIVSGRSIQVKQKTIDWMVNHTGISSFNLIMRDIGDHTPDHDLKRGWLLDGPLPPKKNILCVYEDRKRVVDMWRKEGLTCFQVSDGEF